MDIFQVRSLAIKEHGKTVLENVSFTICAGDQWAIVGPSGSGKTTLLHALAGKHAYTGSILYPEDSGASRRMVMVDQQHRFRNLSNMGSFYYQQRFNSSDADDALTVEQDLQGYIQRENTAAEPGEVKNILSMLKLEALLPTRLIQLSNGENKRLQIAKALLLHPAILLLDNPFTGLDVDARKILSDLLGKICRKGIQVVMVTSAALVPECITHVLSLDGNGGYRIQGRDQFTKEEPSAMPFTLDEKLLGELVKQNGHNFGFAVRMNNVHIEYHHKVILSGVSWQVKRGERWALSGPNGAGKSTLLSLINADNPQAYANDIYLFDRKRGTGETIWEIKKKIGFVSPELHLYFDTGMPAFDVVASGLFDTIGLFRALSEAQSDLVLQWMRLLKIEHLRSKMLFRLSGSEQRLVLLARALVKDPPLLILDEPCQGLDETQVSIIREMVDKICVTGNKTLIYVSHIPAEIPACVNRFIRLEEGRVVGTD
jgi:molybdate transport system ATP-binding protein